LVDVAMDADSEIITAVNVLPANGDEGADAARLIAQEEEAHGNDVEAVSMDGAGYRGPVLRDLTDPAGLDLEVFTPPTEAPPSPVFPPERFTLTVIDERPTLTCPAGATTTKQQRNEVGTGDIYRFHESDCAGCPLRTACLSVPTTKCRAVTKNDYEAEYTAAKAKAQTPAYATVRRRHPAIERKLPELVRRHDLRHARYRGRVRVLYQRHHDQHRGQSQADGAPVEPPFPKNLRGQCAPRWSDWRKKGGRTGADGSKNGLQSAEFGT
jgi:hypothetical protein